MCRKSIISSVLLAALILTTFAACGESGDVGTPAEAVTDSPVETVAETEEDIITPDSIIREKYADSSYDGKEFHFLSPSIGEHFYSALGSNVNEVWSEEENGDVMNDAIYHRNAMTEELLGVKIVPIWGGGDDAVTNKLKKAVMAGSDEYDAVLGRMDFFGTGLTSGYLYNIYDIEPIDTADSWWDANIVDNFTLFGNKLYWISGDINSFDDYAVEVTYFNKKLCDDNALAYPYETVLSGNWTIDKFNSYAQTVINDLNGDGVLNPTDDIVGHIENNDEIKHWIYAMGEKSIEIGDDGELLVNTLNDRQINAVDTLFHYMVEEQMTYSGYETEIFRIDHALFMGNMLGPINKLRDMDSDFGIIPMPKMDEAQENYGEYVSNGWTTAVAVPITSPDIEYTGKVLDAMCAFSTATVRNALYDISLNVKLVRDEESVQTLDIILASKSYDWAVDFSWGSTFQSVYNGIYSSKSNNYVSAATKAYDKQVKTINNLIEKIAAL